MIENLFLFFAPIFIVGSLWFWIVLAGLFCWMIYVTETESRFLTLFTAAGVLGVLWGVYEISPWTLLTQHGWMIPLAILGYFAVGCLWSMVRWTLWNNHLFDTARSFIIHTNEYEVLSREEKLKYLGRILINNCIISGPFPPSPSQYKARIVFWITNWPFSLVWTVLNDPLRKLADFLYRRLGKVYSGITNWVTDRHLGKV